ncbi:unnamed protein product [Ranitomeya imitator]|uniref:Uncharacterized protein n=1 Tax=Ranitomeya imitator TaxID=111125 RepID=A0ABN9M1T0_9NEOB|nr:unnamed protein product [Ranitomeya imitator]
MEALQNGQPTLDGSLEGQTAVAASHAMIEKILGEEPRWQALVIRVNIGLLSAAHGQHKNLQKDHAEGAKRPSAPTHGAEALPLRPRASSKQDNNKNSKLDRKIANQRKYKQELGFCWEDRSQDDPGVN